LPSTAGTTASIAFIRKGKLYTGHCGDSGIVMGYENARPNAERKWLAHPLTIDHKPESKDERKRIESYGGKVMEKQSIHRVVWYRPKFPHLGPILRNTEIEEVPFLAVARSLGDLWSYNWKTEKFMVSPEPDVAVCEIDSLHHKCLVFGSDGLWNMIDGQRAVDLFYECEMINADNKLRGIQSWRNPARYLVEASLQRWRDCKMRSDNTTVVCVAIDGKRNPHDAQSQECTRAIYDYSTNEAYNLDYIDPYHMQNISSYSNYCANQSLPSFSNVNYTPCIPSTSAASTSHNVENYADLQYYANTSTESAFVKSCCPDQRFVLASNDEEIHHHESYEHHKQVYENMTQKKFPPLHYAYRPVPVSHYTRLPSIQNGFLQSSPFICTSRTIHERYNYIRPSEKELEELHREPTEEEKRIFEENYRRQFADTPTFDSDEESDEGEEMKESDDEGMQWSDAEDKIEDANKSNEACFGENYEAKMSENDVESAAKTPSEKSIQIFEISSSNLGINDKKMEKEKVQSLPKKQQQPENKENSENLRKRKSTKACPGRIYQTRQMERRTRSTRVIQRVNLQKRVAKSVKKLVKTLSSDSKMSGNAIMKKLEPISTNVTSTRASAASNKNKENNNNEKASSSSSDGSVGKNLKVSKVEKRVLRSSQTEMKEAPSTTQQKTTMVRKVVNIVRNLRSHANQPVTSDKTHSHRRKTIKVK
jgi:serine/threonine protein phosphatase PrpC